MAHPLELSYNWQTPVLVSSVGAIICVGVLARSQVAGWLSVALILVGLWLGFLALVLLRTRAYLMVDGATLTVRRFTSFHRIDGQRVSAVKEFVTPSGPSYTLSVTQDDGRTARYVAPVALLRAGHSTLFRWILTWAPAADLDQGSRRTLDQLRTRGLVE